ncbi:efflux RND transporter periplasmic adaptor subunit [Rhodoplanes sp. Z2-YC6860]|uniref:efflux RND transporter periplasmic adaptor subunit n=1 Tax=Rhodoplanes sp. Z2-YC6860 TaxID=674703 RepID=UPI00078B86DC|nr:RND family efflux transporter, MFP subunit [Rhodoplanes sp. Z2-YC6860]
MIDARTKAGMIVAAALLSSCGQGNEYKEPPPPKVTVAQPAQQPVTRYLEVNGNTAAVNSTDLVARVAGFVDKINQQDGTAVTKGTLLFTIEPEPYRIKLDQAKAAEAGAEASLKDAEATFQRKADLLGRQTASKADYDQALAARDSAQATLDQAKANTRLAQTNLDYTQVTAPFDGIVTARQVSIGQYVGGSATPTVLASIVQAEPIYTNFNISEQDVQRVRTEMRRRGIAPSDIRKVPAEIGLQTETGYPHRGTLDYAAPNVDPSTGTLAVRAIFENTDRVLLPGYFVRVRVPLGEPKTSLLVPDVALGSDQGGRYLLVVNKDNVVEQRKVELGPQVDTLRVIDSGISADDRVVVGGLLRAIPGQKVDPQTQTASAAPASSNAR